MLAVLNHRIKIDMALFMCASLFVLDLWSKAAEPVVQPLIHQDPAMGMARVHFRRHEYLSAIMALGKNDKTLEAKWIRAESLFRLQRFREAKKYFEAIVKDSRDAVERRKAAIRLFDIDLANKDMQRAIDRFVAFRKRYKKPTEKMRYGLGKALYDIGYHDHAKKILGAIRKGDEFFMRAQYIVAAMDLSEQKPQVSLKRFKTISSLPPMSVEDYSVRELATLAQARILVDNGREDLAGKVYSQVDLGGELGEVATAELARAMMNRASMARNQNGRFRKSSEAVRRNIESSAIETALNAIGRFNEVQRIDWHTPELFTIAAELYVWAGRYDEARVAYSRLIDHYRTIYKSLLSKGPDGYDIKPYFAIDYHRNPKVSKPMVEGVADGLLRDVKGIDEILKVRDRIEANGNKLRELEIRAAVSSGDVRNKALIRSRAGQLALEDGYRRLVIKRESKVKGLVAEVINQALAEVEFKRAELVLCEMNNINKKQKLIQEFQVKKIGQFDARLKELDEGGKL